MTYQLALMTTRHIEFFWAQRTFPTGIILNLNYKFMYYSGHDRYLALGQHYTIRLYLFSLIFLLTSK